MAFIKQESKHFYGLFLIYVNKFNLKFLSYLSLLEFKFSRIQQSINSVMNKRVSFIIWFIKVKD
jgi:hypothetical protein